MATPRVNGTHRKDIKDVYIAVTGITGAGKSEFISLCTQRDVKVGHTLQSETSQVEDWTFMYNPKLRVHLIDTPGFDDTNKKDVQVLRDIAGWLGTTYKEEKILLSGLIYLHPIIDTRLRGSAKRNLFMFKKLCGPDCLPGVALVSTMWERVEPQVGTDRENELRQTPEFWGDMETGGSRIMRHLRTRESALGILEVILRHSNPMLLKIQDQMLNEGLDLDDTDAGINVNEELIAAQREHKAEIEALRKDMKDADDQSKREIAALIKKEQDNMEENKRQRAQLQANMKELQDARDSDMKEMKAQLEKHVNSLKDRENEIKDLKKTLEEKPNEPGLDQVEKDRLNKRLDEMEKAKAEELRKVREERDALLRRSKRGLFERAIDWIDDLFH